MVVYEEMCCAVGCGAEESGGREVRREEGSEWKRKFRRKRGDGEISRGRKGKMRNERERKKRKGNERETAEGKEKKEK